MKIQYLGHACFLLAMEDGTRLVTDPYEAGAFNGAVGYGKVAVDADAVTVSHDHADHADVSAVGGDPRVFDSLAGGDVESVTVRAVETSHGAGRGGNRVFVIQADGLRLVHLGDLGHALTGDQVKEIGQPDVLLVPVGGTFTIDATTAAAVADALGAKVVIPMHYKTPKFGLDIAPVNEFLDLQPDRVRQRGSSECEVARNALPERPEVWVLEPAR